MTGRVSTVLRWPLWSWRNLSVTTAAVLLVFYGMGHVVEPAKIRISAFHGPALTSSPTASSPSPSESSTTVPSPGPAAPPSTTASSRVLSASGSESVTRVATAFAQAWSSSGRSQQEWTTGIQAFVTPALAAGLAQTDPARVPATKITGEALLLTASATFARVRVPTDGGSIVVTLTRAASRPWQVSDVAPVGQPSGTPTPNLHPAPTPTRG
jgi:hypothetical protein